MVLVILCIVLLSLSSTPILLRCSRWREVMENTILFIEWFKLSILKLNSMVTFDRKVTFFFILNTQDNISQIPMVNIRQFVFRTSCSNFTMIQRLMSSGSLFYWDRFGCMRENESVLGEEEGKTKLRERWSVETYHQSETNLMCLYL